MKELHHTPTERRRITRNKIYRFLYTRPEGCSKQEIADALSLSLPTVHQNVSELLQAELIRPAGINESKGGRPALRLTVAENVRFALGISVSDQHIRVLAANLRLEEVAYQKYEHPHFQTLAEMGAALSETVEKFMQRFGLNPEKLLGVGIALPAVLNADLTQLINAPTLHLRNVELRPLIEAFTAPVAVGNDAVSGGYAEWFARKKRGSLVYLSLEDGVGGAIMVNNSTYIGDHGRSGEFGHICVHPGGLRCRCGQQGCLEAYCSSARLSSDLGITVEHFFNELHHENLSYQILWKDYLSHLAAALSTIRMSFDCDIVLGGYLSQYLQPYLEDLRALAAARDPFDADGTFVHLCKYPKHAAPLGAALQFIDRFLKEL